QRGRAERGGWNGRWVTVVVRERARPAAERTEARRRFTAARLAELREGVWLRPTNIDVTLSPDVAAAVVVFDTEPRSDARGLAASLWDLGARAARAERLPRRRA